MDDEGPIAREEFQVETIAATTPRGAERHWEVKGHRALRKAGEVGAGEGGLVGTSRLGPLTSAPELASNVIKRLARMHRLVRVYRRAGLDHLGAQCRGAWRVDLMCRWGVERDRHEHRQDDDDDQSNDPAGSEQMSHQVIGYLTRAASVGIASPILAT